MCDTIVAPAHVTADGATILGKNSDREPNEAHHLLRVPRAQHPPNSMVQCTYIEIPQVEETFEVLLAKPFWIWGAEMGANEHGVAIGNEAVFTKIPYQKEPGLIGMDFIRLALERAKTALEALKVITALLETYGQSGNCGYQHPTYYHNSFIIADPSEAWVLETADRHWMAERVTDIRSISNGLTIGSEWDLASNDVVQYAIERGWCKGRDDFHFARCYSDLIYTRFSRCNERQCRTRDLLAEQKGAITVKTAMRALRDHGPDAGPDWSPARGILNFTICAHGGFGPVRQAGQTMGSMVSHLGSEVQTHFVTGTAAPCTSIFKPLWLGSALPDTGPVPDGAYDEASLFWRHEVLHRATLRNYPARITLYKDERDALEQQFVEGAEARLSQPLAERVNYSVQCFAQADEAEANWTQRVLETQGRDRQRPLYAAAWRAHNKAAQLPEGLRL